MKPLDFLVIGTQKGGTKMYYEYLRQHSQIFLPYAMEIGFFALDEEYQRGLDWYLKEYFDDAPADRLWGEVSPQYMSAIQSAQRIRRAYPDIRLVASLRNPIDRAYSAYRMMVTRSLEQRSFEEVVAELKWDPSQASPDIGHDELLNDFEYFRVGLYSKILAAYLAEFPAEQIMVTFIEDLQAEPESNFRKVLEFIGADGSILPPNLGQQYHEGGEARLPALNAFLESAVYRMLAKPIKRLVPKNARNFAYRVQQLNKKAASAPALDPELRSELRSLFQDDVNALENQFGIQVPWPEFKQ